MGAGFSVLSLPISPNKNRAFVGVNFFELTQFKPAITKFLKGGNGYFCPQKKTTLPRKFPKNNIITKNDQILPRSNWRNLLFVIFSFPKAPGKNEFSEHLSESGAKSNPGPETGTVIIFNIC